MNIEQLKYIVEVAKAGSISGAAQKLHVSLATLSQSISSFEKKYGVEIFSRSRMGTIPTEIGANIIELAKDMIKKSQEIEKVVEQYANNGNQQLKLLSTPPFLLTVLPKATSQVRNKFPAVNIEIRQQGIRGFLESLNQYEADIGFISVNRKLWTENEKKYKKAFRFETFFSGQMYVCVGKNSPLAPRDIISPAELLDQPLVLFTITRSFVEDFFAEYGTMKIIFESDNSEIVKKTVSEGGVTFFSDLTFKDDPSVINGQIVPIPFHNYERANIVYGCIRPKTKPTSDVLRFFLKTIRSEIEQGNF